MYQYRGPFTRVWGKRRPLPPHTFIKLLNKINNLNDLFSHKICCLINVQYIVYIVFCNYTFWGQWIAKRFWRGAFSPVVPYIYMYKCWFMTLNHLNTFFFYKVSLVVRQCENVIGSSKRQNMSFVTSMTRSRTPAALCLSQVDREGFTPLFCVSQGLCCVENKYGVKTAKPGLTLSLSLLSLDTALWVSLFGQYKAFV